MHISNTSPIHLQYISNSSPIYTIGDILELNRNKICEKHDKRMIRIGEKLRCTGAFSLCIQVL